MADNKIYKSLNLDKSDEKVKHSFGNGVISFVSWDRLIPYLNQCVDKKVDEIIDGVRVDGDGIHVKLINKKTKN